MKDREHFINLDESFFYEGEVDFFLTEEDHFKDKQSQLDAMQKDIIELKAMVTKILGKK